VTTSIQPECRTRGFERYAVTAALSDEFRGGAGLSPIWLESHRQASEEPHCLVFSVDQRITARLCRGRCPSPQQQNTYQETMTHKIDVSISGPTRFTSILPAWGQRTVTA
jgi:hypothetical protein